MNHVKLKNLPKSDRPYEKFLELGEQALTDSELLSIIIRTGSRELSALEIVRQLLIGKHNNILNIYEFSVEELCRFRGIGKVKAIQIKAIAELSRRISKTNNGYNIKMNSPITIANYYMEQLRHKNEEHFVVAYFDMSCNFLGDERLSKGCVNSTFVSPREIFKNALSKNAVAIVMIHNHPSGNPIASIEDRRITKRVQECGELLGIKVIDHIIIGDNRYFSFKEEKIIE
ncbi:DNA repair protein RadC [Lachnobacterium bovis DSM 14045]|jgi:DNA repair protein RadC|uniref:DNA repair protein RadC n=1 Tax=Lachnobacterium bovis DSM 14045 TaxID=1122142 RepID=A0A1H3F6V7_9FIRM|nr:DNA repair protein RadC [Lachnobacterium bovis DSM 14045]